jgi:hypothetical protein
MLNLIDLGIPPHEYDLPNNSLERTQPQRDVMYDVAVLRRSARGRYAPSAPAAKTGAGSTTMNCTWH